MQKVTDELETARARAVQSANPLAPDVLQLAAALDKDRAALEELRDNFGIIDRSKFARLRSLFYIVKSLLGVAGKRDRFVAVSDRSVVPELTASSVQIMPALPRIAVARPRDPYQRWLLENELRDADIARMRDAAPHLALRPTFSVIVPTYNSDERYLRRAIESVFAQVYPNWELCIADDASTEPHVAEILNAYAARDPRVRVTFRETNGMISRASNTALETATGEFVAFLDHDDAITPDALYANAVVVNRQPDVDMIYSDEDKINEEDLRSSPFFKPGWSPETLLSKMYTCHLGVYRRSLVAEVGGLRPEFDGSQDWDLALRVSERTDRVAHIPQVLYHWRIHAGSAASGADAKPYAYVAARRAIADALQRRGESGRIEVPRGFPESGSYVVRYDLRAHPKVSIIVPTRDKGQLVRQCVSSICDRSTYDNFEIVLVDNGSTEPESLAAFEALAQTYPKLRVERYDVPFNYSKINNFGAQRANGDVLLFLNNDTEVIERDWIEAMLEQAQRPPIGCVGAMLLYADDRIQHAGVVLGIGGVAGHSHRFLPSSEAGHYNIVQTTTNYIAVTAACLMVRRAVFEEAGGFDETMAVAFNDVDFCLRVWKAGYRNVYVPGARLYHYESATRGYNDTPEKLALAEREEAVMKERYGELLLNDPYYNPNYTLKSENYALRVMDDG